ncbi:peptidase C14 [Exidia glandulosa HHB12029]|uniref:Peptidase C14 n=1 Tax=Exidia glandulosa HHB12029 TaxID=1314781 RepID=A0A165LPQ0_EXIGL|nr:peptidase C14 [Exidia glandulosa HHB12029]
MVCKALLVGIQYKGRKFKDNDASAELTESHRDVKRVRQLIMQKYGYTADHIKLMMDDGVNMQPTRANIIGQIHNLVKGAKSGDRLFFHFSGHGSQVPDDSGDEADGYDEAIWPLDFVEHKFSTYIIDDELRAIMVNNLPAGCRLTALFDSCHSGTILDLPNEHFGTPRSTPQQKTIALPPVGTPPAVTTPIDIPAPKPQRVGTMSTPPIGTPPRTMSASTPPMGTPPQAPRSIYRVVSSHFQPLASVTSREDSRYGLLSLPYNVQFGLDKRARGAVKKTARADDPPSILFLEPGRKEKEVYSPGAITSWAACADDQNAYEGIDGAGAMVKAFVESLEMSVEHTYATLLQSISEKLEDFCERMNKDLDEDEQIKQVPQMGSLHRLDLEEKFTL